MNSPQGKLDFLLGRVGGGKSGSRGEFFAERMGYDDASLDAAYEGTSSIISISFPLVQPSSPES